MAFEVRRYLDEQAFLGGRDSGSCKFTRRVPVTSWFLPYEPGTVLRFASVSTDLEAIVDGFRFRPLFPDRKMFP